MYTSLLMKPQKKGEEVEPFYFVAREQKSSVKMNKSLKPYIACHIFYFRL